MRLARKKLFLFLGLTLIGIALGSLLLSLSSLPWEEKAASTSSVQANWLELREAEADRTVWAKEIEAEICGLTIEKLWDSINGTTNKLQRIAACPVEKVILPGWGPVQHLPHGIEKRQGTNSGETISAPQWRQLIEKFRSEGWRLEGIEFRHNQFGPATNSQPAHSQFYFSAHLTNENDPARAMLEGTLSVEWAAKQPGQESPTMRLLDASHLKLKTHAGSPFFEKVFDETIVPSDNIGLIDPLILYDLDGDGLSEIILASRNLVYRRKSANHFESQPLCRFPVPFVTTAIIADFDGDGFADFLCANGRGLYLFKGSSQGTFDEPARLVWTAPTPLKDAMVMTCGDIAHTGHLDVFLGQYKVPSLGQILRPHYYDANDGWPCYLLRNDGQGNFTDVTESSGLGSKRSRRTYSASLVDLNHDGHLDLVVISDFAGLDLYQNDGKGSFSDVTHQWVAEPHAFGMASAFADFNLDGRLDLLMIGMPSPTVDRLEHLGLERGYSPEDRRLRAAMTFGNRLYLAQSEGGFTQTRLNDSIARSGWSWGCSAFDFDNDGFPDVHIANGLQSNRSVRDYEGEFWLHDLFVEEAVDDVTASQYFIRKNTRTRGSGWSYGGYERNRLFLNQEGDSFIEIGHLAGVSLDQDSRNVVSDDLDGDGRVDLLVTTHEIWPEVKQTLKIFKNQVSDGGHWIAFRFREQGEGKSPVGVSVTIHYENRNATRHLVTGDSHRSQSANTIHFGLGHAQRIKSAEIRWVNGHSITLSNPEVDQYHNIKAPQ
jgi:hypothetical protein